LPGNKVSGKEVLTKTFGEERKNKVRSKKREMTARTVTREKEGGSRPQEGGQSERKDPKVGKAGFVPKQKPSPHGWPSEA